MSRIELLHGDCLELLPTLKTGEVDAGIIDPPYLTTDLDFDRRGLDMQWVQELLRIIKPNGYLAVFCPVEMAAEIAKTWRLRFTGAWVKQIGGMRTATAKKPRNQWELYTVFAHPEHEVKRLTWNPVLIPGEPYKRVQRNRGFQRDGKNQIDRANTQAWTVDGFVSSNSGTRQQTDVIFAPNKCGMRKSERTIHPTQKPEIVVGTLIQWLTNPGDTVLDCFMGSGTTGVACKNLGRNFIGIEQDEKYAQLARHRIFGEEAPELYPAERTAGEAKKVAVQGKLGI